MHSVCATLCMSMRKIINDIQPFGKARPRMTRRGRAYMPKSYRAKKKRLGAQFGEVPNAEFLAVRIIAARRLPKSWSGAKKDRHRGKLCDVSPDVDNIAGAVMDALFPKQDKHIVELSCKKIWSDRDDGAPYLDIEVTAIA